MIELIFILMVSHGHIKRKITEKRNEYMQQLKMKYKTQLNQGKALSMKGLCVWAKWLYKHLTLNIIQRLFQCAAVLF